MRELLLSFLLLLALPSGLEAAAPGRSQIATPLKNNLSFRQPWIVVSRGGSDDTDEGDSDEYDSEAIEEDIVIEDDEDDEYDDETEEEEDIVMVKSAVRASQKAKAKKTTAVKETVNAKLSVNKTKRPSLVKRYVPYIVRASLSPLTLLAMTKAYFASLFNLDYLAEDSSHDLRSALEEKAKKSGSAGGRKGKRMMKPGQAKTLSDLPQLNT